MSDPTVLLLSRIQFGFVMSFHIIFPAFTIGLASWLAFLAGVYLKTRRALWRELYVFWLKIFAVSFALGVVSGIVMSFQFGTNWAELSTRAGNILGPAARVRSADGVLPGSDVPRRDAVRLAPRVAAAALPRHLHGGARHADLDVLDHLGEQLDAHARRLRASSTAYSMPAELVAASCSIHRSRCASRT